MKQLKGLLIQINITCSLIRQCNTRSVWGKGGIEGLCLNGMTEMHRGNRKLFQDQIKHPYICILYTSRYLQSARDGWRNTDCMSTVAGNTGFFSVREKIYPEEFSSPEYFFCALEVKFPPLVHTEWWYTLDYWLSSTSS